MTLDATDLSNFLSLRAFERERRRVETLQANVLEKQRLRREVALYRANAAEREAARLRAIEEERRRQLAVEAAARQKAEAEARALAEKKAAAEAAAAKAAEEAARKAEEEKRTFCRSIRPAARYGAASCRAAEAERRRASRRAADGPDAAQGLDFNTLPGVTRSKTVDGPAEAAVRMAGTCAEICPASSPLALDPVQHMDPQRRGEIAVRPAAIVNFGDQLRKRDFPGCRRSSSIPARRALPARNWCGGHAMSRNACGSTIVPQEIKFRSFGV